MAFEGFRPVPIARLGSLVTNYAQEKLPQGVSPDARNVKYRLSSVQTRYGVGNAISTGLTNRINSLGVLITNTLFIPILFDTAGNLSKETTVGVATTAITPTFTAQTPNAGDYMNMTSVYQRAYMAFGSMKAGTTTPLVYNGTQLDPCSMRPVGEPWQPLTRYEIGECVTPRNGGNGRLYRNTHAGGGISGASDPTWATDGVSNTLDGNVGAGTQCVWVDATPQMLQYLPTPKLVVTRNAGTGAFPAGRDVYIFITVVNGNGETTGSTIYSFVNTTLNDGFAITPQTPTLMASWETGLPGAAAPTTYKVYEADVPTGNAAPVVSAFKLYGTSAVLSASAVVGSSGTGAAPPTTNTASVTTVGNICGGQRWGSVLFVNRNGNISGAALQGVFTGNMTAGLQMMVANIPIGPANTVQRIVAFTVPLLDSFGPYLYIANNDTQSGIAITTTVINDNTTTVATFNFTDSYLQDATDVTNAARKIRLPAQANVVFNKRMRRLFWFGEQPSLVRVSEADDPETYYGDTGFFYISRDDGQRAWTSLEWRGETYVFKERSAFTITASEADPVQWEIVPRWSGFGPCGPRAVFAGAEFIAFAHRSGGYIYDGSNLTCVTREIDDQWDQINWDQAHLITVHIDDDEKEARFCVPFGGSTLPNLTFTMNFERGLDHPIHYSAFAGKEIAIPTSRKWSLDDIGASMLLRAERPITASSDARFRQSQILVATDNGTVGAITPNQFFDYSSVGFDSHYETASVGFGDSIVIFGGMSLAARGNGVLTAQSRKYGSTTLASYRNITLLPNPVQFAKYQAHVVSRQVGLRFSNSKVAGAWFELMDMTLYVKPTFDGEFV